MVLRNPLTVVWTDRSVRQLNSIKNYLLEEWGLAAAKKFREEVDRTIFTISINPFGFKGAVPGNQKRIAVIVKQVSLVYKFDTKNNRIVVLRLWDNRMNPPKLKF